MTLSVTVMPKGAMWSRINWVAILTAVAGASALGGYVPMSWLPTLMLASGVATYVLRTFFTTRPIELGAGS